MLLPKVFLAPQDALSFIFTYHLELKYYLTIAAIVMMMRKKLVNTLSRKVRALFNSVEILSRQSSNSSTTAGGFYPSLTNLQVGGGNGGSSTSGLASSLTNLNLNSPGKNSKLRSLIAKNLNEIKKVGSRKNLDTESDVESNDDSSESGGAIGNNTSIENNDKNNNSTSQQQQMEYFGNSSFGDAIPLDLPSASNRLKPSKFKGGVSIKIEETSEGDEEINQMSQTSQASESNENNESDEPSIGQNISLEIQDTNRETKFRNSFRQQAENEGGDKGQQIEQHVLDIQSPKIEGEFEKQSQEAFENQRN